MSKIILPEARRSKKKKVSKFNVDLKTKEEFGVDFRIQGISICLSCV